MRRNAILCYVGAALALSGCSSNGGSNRLELLANLKLPGTLRDIWGYFDEASGVEYALVGFGPSSELNENGVHIVDVSNPRSPIAVTSVTEVPGFDIKTWHNYMYTVSGTSGRGGIVDLTDPRNPRVVGTFPSAHNIFIDGNGFLYAACPGLQIYDLNRDPTDPQKVWEDDTPSCHDAAVIGERLFDFHGISGTRIYDVRDPRNPVFLGGVLSPSLVFHHSGWTSADGQVLYICDEGARHPLNDITGWDIRDPANPTFLTQFSDSTATVHNLYVVGDFAYAAYYTAGFRVFDVSNPNRIQLVDELDTSDLRGESFAGAFGVYPFTRSGVLYVSDVEAGLFVLAFRTNSTPPQQVLAP